MDGFTRGEVRDVAARAEQGIGAADRSLRASVEAERRRLSKADAILASLSIALDHADNIEADGTQFSLVADAVRELIGASMEALDSTRLGLTEGE